MIKDEFRQFYYLERQYQQISENEFNYRLLVKRRDNDIEVTGVETRINTFNLKQDLADSQLSITPIDEVSYLNQTIRMLFHLQMLRLNIEDSDTINSQMEISEFFLEPPFCVN